MTKDELKRRTKLFALRIIKLVNALPSNAVGRAVSHQLVRSGMSVGANYRSACRGRSKAEFIAKCGISLEEVDECGYWLELIMEAELLPTDKVLPLHKEADELAAMLFSIIKTSKASLNAKS